MEPSVAIRLGRRLGLLPIALEHVVAPMEDLTVERCRHSHAERGHAGAAELLRTLARRQMIPLGATAVHGRQRRGLGQAVDLDELPTEFGLHALDGARGRRRARDDHAYPPPTRNRAVP